MNEPDPAVPPPEAVEGGADPAATVAALRAALAAERLKGAAFAELSHELRTLISGVIGLTGLLLDTDLTAEQRDYVKRVRGFSDALVGLVNNVLDFSRFEAGALSLERTDLDVRRLADEVGELCAERARARGVELVTSVANDVPALRGDPSRLRQVLMNLVSNALKFTDHGEVVLRATVAASTATARTGAEGRVVVRFDVRDTGVGISPEGQARLFRPFSQVHAGDVGQFGAGSGLGLALSKQIVTAMGGDIGVTSQPGRGSTFHVTVPLERRSAAPERSSIPRVDMAGRRVLCAAGNAASRTCLAEMMAPLGVAFSSAVDAHSALAALREVGRSAPYDVLLLDVGLSGAAELMRALDAEEALALLPVVLLAYPGQRWDEAEPETHEEGRPRPPLDSVPEGARAPQRPITLGGSGLRATGTHPTGSGRTGSRASARVIAALAKPVRQAHLHACLFTLMGSAVETMAGSAPAPESRRPSTLGASSVLGETLPRPATLSRRSGAVRLTPGDPPPASVRGASIALGPSPTASSTTSLPASGASSASSASSAAPGAPEPAEKAAAAVAPAAARVLLVEDNAVNQRVAKIMMEKRGYEVDVAGDGHEAVEATRRVGYAAVLMDCHMPRLDGYSATLEIRRRDAGLPRVPIIAMTANAGPGARERCLAAGMDDYVAKPVTAEALDEVLRRWVPRAPPPPSAPPPAVRRPSSPTVDLGMLRKLRTTQGPGEPDIVTEVIALFLQDAPTRVTGIQDAVARGDLAVAARMAHTLKGSAGHLGAKTLSALCARFEEKVRAGAPFNVTFAVGAIADELDRVSAALHEESRGPKAPGG